MSHECKHDSEISVMQTDIREIRDDVKKILEWKGMIFGGIVVMSTIVSIVVGLAAEYIKKEEKKDARRIESYDTGRSNEPIDDGWSTGS